VCLSDGVIKRAARNRWPVVEVLSQLVKFYRSESRRGHRSAADGELRRARAREIELRTALRAHELVEQSAAVEVVEDVTALIVVGLQNLAPRVAGRDLRLRKLIESEIYSIRETVARRSAAARNAPGGTVGSSPTASSSNTSAVRSSSLVIAPSIPVSCSTA
jgi:hypothetical protein